MTGSGVTGNICGRIFAVSGTLKSRSGWEYRRLEISDKSMGGSLLVSENKFSEWSFQPNDCLICNVKSNGVDNRGKLSFFFNEFLGPFDSAEILFELASERFEQRMRSSEHMKSNETVYQISAREARSLLELIRLWILEGRPQHYTKWCQMHQIVATNLYYLGLAKRTASMSGYYYPTDEAIDFFSGKKTFPKRKVFTRDKSGKHLLVSDEGERRLFSDYLSDHSDRQSALQIYSEALKAYHEKLQESRLSSTT